MFRLYACDGKIDAIVVGAGTGGTISGIAKRIKEKIPNCKVYFTHTWKINVENGP